ncbi:hypothetical protein LXL04_035518 [Taraxacum kok-saghyz]
MKAPAELSWLLSLYLKVKVVIMSESQTGNGAHTLHSHGKVLAREHIHDWLVLLLLVSLELFLNLIEPFHRYVGEEMMIEMKYPFYQKDTIPMYAVPLLHSAGSLSISGDLSGALSSDRCLSPATSSPALPTTAHR